MLHDAGKKLLPSRISGSGAARGKVLQHDGSRYKPTWGPLYPAAIIKSGAAAVGTDVFVPGLLIPEAGTVTQLGVAVRTAPTGASLIVVFKLVRTGATIGTVTVAAGALSGSTAVEVAVLQWDLVQTDITQVGSTVAGADVVAVARVVT